jgi:DNA polymerase-1
VPGLLAVGNVSGGGGTPRKKPSGVTNKAADFSVPVPQFEYESRTVADADALSGLMSVLAVAAETAAIVFADDIYVCFDGRTDYKIVLQKDLLSGGFQFEAAIAALTPFLSGGVKKLVYDVKALRHTLSALGISLGGAEFDVKIAQYLLDVNIKNETAADLVAEYALPSAAPAASLWHMTEAFKAALEKDGLSALFATEMRVAGVLYEMETRGFLLNIPALDDLSTRYAAELQAITREIYADCGCEFNVNSPKQLGEVLFGKLNLPHGAKGKGAYSTDAGVLENLIGEHPAIPKILRFRTISKLKNTYVEGLRKLADAGGSVHTVFKQTATATGRLSSAEPTGMDSPCARPKPLMPYITPKLTAFAARRISPVTEEAGTRNTRAAVSA